MRIIDYPSLNFNNRAFLKPDMIIIHYTGMQSAQSALERMCDDTAPRVSAHYFIDKQGVIYRLVCETKRAWHAGVSIWEGISDINSRSIGIELENKGHEWGYHTFPKAQINALIRLLDTIRTRYNILDKNIIGHSDIAPLRKKDPGELFPWHDLADAGHGIAPYMLGAMLYHHKTGILFQNLRNFGYGCDKYGYFTPLNRMVFHNFMTKIK